MEYEVKDSGKREEYSSGMVRDTQEGKPDYTLIDQSGLERVAIHLTKAVAKYGRDNWRKANSNDELVRFRSSAIRHIFQWLRGDTDEDHMAATVFNLFAHEYVKGKLEIRPDTKLVDGGYYVIQITKSSGELYWYRNAIGTILSAVYNEPEDAFYVGENFGEMSSIAIGGWVLSADCKVISVV